MCFKWGAEDKYKTECGVLAIVTLIANTLLLCLSIFVLVETKNPDTCGPPGDTRLCTILTAHFGSHDVVIVDTTSSIGGVICILGLVASVALMYGLKYDKPGYIIIYICYGLQAIIFFLLITLFALLRTYWYIAANTLLVFVASIYGLFVAIRVYNAMSDTKNNGNSNDITSDVQLLIED
ncbi:uncharacterized protein [Epargyreus clarus]|uniref:uncharacterized protein n=1 Tax=Epargyreus clarus TaxID=520877 RepID=UPI003C2AE7A9